jgi:hypothetical protein
MKRDTYIIEIVVTICNEKNYMEVASWIFFLEEKVGTQEWLTRDTQMRKGAVARSAKRVKSLSNFHSWSRIMLPLPMKTG